MEIDPLIELAHALHSRPGVYALLLGSGISRSAGIPTGYEVTLELIRRLATLEGIEAPADSGRWFQERYNEAPSYSAILERLAPLPAERQGQLRTFFEPTETERAEGRKVPTPAHRSIARLAAHGLVRAIVTTNFDRLLEQALQDEGVAPVIVHNADSATGAPPLVHNRCTLVKVHGDYLDTRIKNTTAELGAYEPALDALLDRVLDEYGLVVCGWSGDWDEALRRALERSPARRYSTYWCSRGEPGESAARLIAQRGARVVRIEDADHFFDALTAKTIALDELDRPHPRTVALAEAELKRYLTRPEDRIRLNDLVLDAADTTTTACALIHSNLNEPVNGVTLAARLRRYDVAVDLLLNLLRTGVYFGGAEHAHMWVRALPQLSALPLGGGYDVWINVRRYPTLLALYACGLAAVAAGGYGTLAKILADTTVRDENVDRVKALLDVAVPERVVRVDHAKLMPGLELQHTPVQDHLFEVMAPLFHRIASGAAFDELFDRWEYLYCLILATGMIVRNEERRWIPVGRYGWARKGDNWVGTLIRQEINAKGSVWPPYAAGLFGSAPIATLLEACGWVEKQVAARHWS